MEATINQIEELVSERLTAILTKMGLEAELSFGEEDGVLTVQVATNKDDLLIGHGSEPLLALQHLLRIVLKNHFPDATTSIALNVGDYHERQQARLSEIAKSAAAQARATNLAVHLPLMSSYERRIIHMVIQSEDGVISESDGIGASRRMTIRPA